MKKYFVVFDMDTEEFTFLDHKEPGELGVWIELEENMINKYINAQERYYEISRQLSVIFNNEATK